jgi:uncharacterized protein YdaU (DUF1376 family)
MNYYEHHLGDYMRDTAHLSMVEDGAYRRLMDAYYIKEQPLPQSMRDIFRLTRAVSKQDREAIETVLREFFEETPRGWRHSRCEREIERFRSKSDKARKSINARWERTRNEQQTKNERNTDVSTKPDTNVHPAAYERTTNDIHRAPVPRHQTPDTSTEAKLRTGRGSRLPAGWDPGESGFAFAASQGLSNGRAQTEFERFRDFWTAKAGQDATKADWQATWRNWVRKAVEMVPRSSAAGRSDDIFAGAK